jgi:chromosomal replication initiation ATPase DnaA
MPQKIKAQQLPLDLKSIPALGREDFFVSSCNEFAVHWVEKWPTGWLPFPALILYGERGSGKTHLAEVWRKRANADFLSAENFVALSQDSLLARQQNVVIDRIDLLIGDRSQEEKLFHLYNHSQQAGIFFLGLSRVSPENLNFEIKDLASRFRAAPNAEIAAPDDDLLFKVLAKRFHDQGYIVAEPALSFTVARMERSWEALDHLVNGAIQLATAQKKQITLPLLRDLMMTDTE